MFGVDDAISLGFQAVGLGMSLFGQNKQAEISKQQSMVSKDITLQEQGINDLRQRQMELEARRSQIQNIRNLQRSRALGLQAATTQGANKGSGLQGAYGDLQGQFGFNFLGVSNALEIGRGINQYNTKISQDKMQLSDLGSEMAEAQGWTSLGGALMKAGPPLGNLGANVFSSFGKSSNPYYGPLDYNG